MIYICTRCLFAMILSEVLRRVKITITAFRMYTDSAIYGVYKSWARVAFSVSQKTESAGSSDRAAAVLLLMFSYRLFWTVIHHCGMKYGHDSFVLIDCLRRIRARIISSLYTLSSWCLVFTRDSGKMCKTRRDANARHLMKKRI